MDLTDRCENKNTERESGDGAAAQPRYPSGVNVVVGTTNLKHMTSDLAALHAPLLTAAELRTLSALHSVVPLVELDPVVDHWPDVNMPTVGIGSWLGSLGNRPVGQALSDWFGAGGRLVDTAHGYGTEAQVGAAVEAAVRGGVAARDEIFLTTKIPGPIGNNATLTMLNEAATKLGGIDLALVHWPCPGYWHGANWSGCCSCSASSGLSQRLETWIALEDLQRVGVVRSIGALSYTDAVACCLLRVACCLMRPTTHFPLSTYHLPTTTYYQPPTTEWPHSHIATESYCHP